MSQQSCQSGYGLYVGESRMLLDGPTLVLLDEQDNFRYVDAFVGQYDTRAASQQDVYAWSRLTYAEIREAIHTGSLVRVGEMPRRWMLYRRQ